jgi:hypothetical protein
MVANDRSRSGAQIVALVEAGRLKVSRRGVLASLCSGDSLG